VEEHKIIENLLARLDGPLRFRFIMQPTVATIFAVIDGLRDAKAGRPAYFWALLSTSKYRRQLIKETWKSVGKILIFAIILDVSYQLDVHSTIHPGEVLIIGFVLAIVPYVFLRGPVNRFVSHKGTRSPLSDVRLNPGRKDAVTKP